MSAKERIDAMRRRQDSAERPAPAPDKSAAAVPLSPPPAAAPQPQQRSEPSPKKPRPQRPLFRLPDGSAFAATYDGSAQLWRVTLTVPGLPPFEVANKAIHQALKKLGQRWFAEHGTPSAATPTVPNAGA